MKKRITSKKSLSPPNISLTKGTIFYYLDYKRYLNHLAGPRNHRSGFKSSMAKALNCQLTYISQIIYGNAHISLEQGERLSSFLKLDSEEKHFLILLIQKGRAGTKTLENYFQEQIQSLLNKRKILMERLGGKNELDLDQQATYYSSWIYAATHIAITIPNLQDSKSISNYLQVPVELVNKALDFLISAELAIKLGMKFTPTSKEVRTGRNSIQIINHHSHWRNRAIDSLEREKLSDLHYSAVISLSKEDVILLREKILEFLKDFTDQVKASNSETLFAFGVDFFGLENNPL